jgi:hypothetical protein
MRGWKSKGAAAASGEGTMTWQKEKEQASSHR